MIEVLHTRFYVEEDLMHRNLHFAPYVIEMARVLLIVGFIVKILGVGAEIIDRSKKIRDKIKSRFIDYLLPT
jgi:hypothetical protein